MPFTRNPRSRTHVVGGLLAVVLVVAGVVILIGGHTTRRRDASLETESPSSVRTTQALPAHVQGRTADVASGRRVRVRLPHAAKRGNLLTVFVVWSNHARVSLVDSAHDRFYAARRATAWGPHYKAQVFYARNTVGGPTTVRATFGRSVRFGLVYVDEYSGVGRKAPLQSSTVKAGNGPVLRAARLRTQARRELLYAAAASVGTIRTHSSGYTVRSTASGNLVQDRVTGRPGSYGARARHSGGGWVLQLVAFRSGLRTPAPSPGWPGPGNTGVPAGLTLHECPLTITVSGSYDACHFDGDVTVKANNVRISRSLINGAVDTGGDDTGQTGLVISDTTIDCGCLSTNDYKTPVAIQQSNYTLLRVDLMHAGHGAAVQDNVVIKDSWIHDLGGNTQAHKDGIYSGDGSNVVIEHNNIDCNDGPAAGCTSAIGLLVDFGPITHWSINNNLLNTIGSYCFYGGGGPKPYSASYIAFTNNHFGRRDHPNCGFYGPVTYWDSSRPGMTWSGNVWDDTGVPVAAAY
jgi:hypothetical protein